MKEHPAVKNKGERILGLESTIRKHEIALNHLGTSNRELFALMKDYREAVKKEKEKLEAKINGRANDLLSHENILKVMNKRLSVIENRLDTLESRYNGLSEVIEEFTTVISAVKAMVQGASDDIFREEEDTTVEDRESEVA